jgi:DNA-binding response OmpR family regulator
MTKVLLVEDDNNLREIYEARLAAEGYDISTAKDGEDALAVAKQVKPDLIISDVMMPRISGFEMLDILRNTDGLKHTRIIMLTALGQAEDKTRADSLGADRYLVKSQVTLEDIVKAAQELLNPDASEEAAPTTTAPVTAETNSFSPIAPPDVAAAAHQSQADAAQTTQVSPTLGSLEVTNNPESVVTAMPDIQQPTPAAVTPPQQDGVVPEPADPTFTAPPEPATVFPTDQPASPAIAVPSEPVMPAATAIPTPVAPAPVQPPAPTDTTPSADDETPLIQMPQQPDEINVATVATTDAALSTSQETTAVAEQIENFVNTAPPAVAIVEPQEIIPPASPVDASAAANDQTLQTAVDNLAGDTSNNTAQEAVAPAQAGGTKVIQPISDPSANTNQLETLLAQEEMQTNLEAGITGAPIVGNVTESAPAQSPQASTIEAPQLPVQPAPGGVFIPNTGGDANENAL